jgi:general secretion pathway protein L
LQGEFSRREQSRQLWQPWRAAAVLVVLLTLLHGGMAGARYAALAGEDAQLTAQIEQVYRSAFPESQRVVNARIQMEQKLAELRRGDAGQEFHRLLQHAAPALRSAGIELRALHYSPGLLDIEVTAADLQALDRLKQALDSGPLRAEITGADSSSGGVAGRIALRGAAA